MSVTADIAIGKRKAYEYFLGPLLKYKNEGLRKPLRYCFYNAQVSNFSC
jgi:hypothetical protein